jgi:hypothetical protein
MRLKTAAAAAIVLVGIAGAQEPASRKAESRPLSTDDLISLIEDELQAAQTAFFKEYRDTKDEDKSKLFEEKFPKPEKWFPKLYESAKAAPKSTDAEKALIWIVARSGGAGGGAEALEILGRDHLESDGLGDVAEALARSPTPEAKAFLAKLEEKSPHKEVKGRALFARAEQMTDLVRATETPQTDAGQAAGLAQHRKDLEALLERIDKEFGPVEVKWGGTLGARARAALFELRNLAIGMVAPEITGEGIDGKPLRLSDFKGKVVVLDFWGNW